MTNLIDLFTPDKPRRTLYQQIKQQDKKGGGKIEAKLSKGFEIKVISKGAFIDRRLSEHQVSCRRNSIRLNHGQYQIRL